MFKKFMPAALLLATVLGSGSARAGYVVGTAGVVDLTSTFALPTNTLSTATTFNLNGLTVAGQSFGDFTTDPNANESLGNAVLDTTNPGSFTFGSTAFGTFTGVSISSDAIGVNSRAFDVIGTFSAGTDFTTQGYTSDSETASFTISFTQTGGPGTTVSASSTLSTFPSSSAVTVPEPASIAMVLAGLGLAGVARRVRRSSK